MKQVALYLSIVFVSVSCSTKKETDAVLKIINPLSIESLKMEIPENNPQSESKIRLGARLFFEPALSRDSSISCGSCHLKEYAFSDTVALSDGVGNKKAARNSPTIVNVGYQPHFMSEGGVKTLELQVIAPLENEDEMALGVIEACRRLNQIPYYQDFFQRVWGDSATPFTLTRSLASFERSIVGGTSPFDDFIDGDSAAISKNAINGMSLFYSDRLACNTCHSGPLLTNFKIENNGLAAEYGDNGLFRLTLDPEDKGKFKVPSLRNISRTFPYMHDGRFKTLDEVIDHYARGGESHPNQHHAINGFELTDREKNDLIDFLESLTDNRFQ